MNTVDIHNHKAIKEYLDNAIVKWRDRRKESEFKTTQVLLQKEVDELEEEILIASCYIDAFQSVRVSLFGELLSY